MKQVLAASCVVAGLVTAAMAQGTGRMHELPLAPQNVHWGYYDARVKPALRIASGDRVRFETMVARGLERLKLAGVSDADIPESMRAVEAAVKERGPGPHPMTGPIYVEGAEPGDTLEIRLLAIDFLHPYGVAAFNPGGGVLAGDFPYAHQQLIRWAPGATSVEFRPGVRLTFAPFFGSIGVAPNVLSGRLSSTPPGWHGGNLDNKDLIAGSTLYLPVHVPGALLSIGDGHGMQGDGEVTGAALETSLRGTIDVRVRKGQQLKWPRAETPTHYMTMGLDPDLDEATRLATREMVDYLVGEKRLSREDAYVLCSLAVDLRVTQAVDGTKGIHALIAKAVFK
jgi:acetamidase/formamidase